MKKVGEFTPPVMQVEKGNEKGMQETIEKEQKNLKVVVHYAAAKMPYEQEHANRNETIGTLKTNALNAFGLKEGQHADGNTYTYTLYHHKTPLENLNETLGQVAGDKHTLELKLSQQVTQGQ
jgi:hypothetical protein